MTTDLQLVVGVSDSPSALAAVRVAAHRAAQGHGTLHLLRVAQDVDWLPSMTRGQVGQLPRWQAHDRAILDRAGALVASVEPTLTLTRECRPGDLYAVFDEVSRSATEVVLGRTTQSDPALGFDEWAARHLHCPVIVVDPSGLVASAGHPGTLAP